MHMIINIYSKSSNEIARILSNFHGNSFVFEGIPFPCFEAFVQCLKFPDPEEQLLVAQMDAKAAKEKGRTQRWQETGLVYWKGRPIDRYGREYRELLDRAYDALCENEEFADALLRSKGNILIHTIGKNRKTATVLTAYEFCSMLARKRRMLSARQKGNP